MLELKNDIMNFSFPAVHQDAKISINFQRTLRIPDDDKTYPLPPGLGAFPVRQVDDFKDRVPAEWVHHGGVMLPMYQSEALWIRFDSGYVRHQGQYPFAIKVAAGKVSALTGEAWTSGLTPKDYCVAPPQRWLDGYCIEKGVIRQFVAAPLGSGFTAEEQITGEATWGGIQIEVFPMRAEVFNRRFPYKPPPPFNPRSRSIMPAGLGSKGILRASNSMDSIAEASAVRSMGLAAGGKMQQQVHEDPYDINDWDLQNSIRCFVHLANSMTWKAVTRQDPPYPPLTAQDYTRQGLPWFNHYVDDWKTLAGTGKLKGLKTLLEVGLQKGVQVLPENESVQVSSDKVVQLGNKDAVRSGNW